MTPCRNGGCERPATKEIELRAGFRVEWKPVCNACAARLASMFPVQRLLDPGQPAWVKRRDRVGLPAKVERFVA